jgi:hypothetical protein
MNGKIVIIKEEIVRLQVKVKAQNAGAIESQQASSEIECQELMNRLLYPPCESVRGKYYKSDGDSSCKC